MSGFQQDDLDYLSALIEEPLPDAVTRLSPQQLAALKNYTQAMIRRESAALDRYLGSSVTAMKFIPGFVLGSFAPGFMAPNLAAHAIKFIPPRKVVSMSSTIPVSYLGEVFVLLDADWQVQLLERLKPAITADIARYVRFSHPAKYLDIAEQLPDTALGLWTAHIDLTSIDDARLSAHRKATLARMRAGVEE